jgi:cell division protein FtsI/penicillin-binding protein 2
VRVRLLLVAVMLLIPVIAPLAGCGVFGSDPRDAAVAFLDAVAGGNAEAAGRLTDNPAAAAGLIRQVRGELKPTRVQLAVDQVQQGQDNTASASYSAEWDLGAHRVWRYPGHLDLVSADTDAGWAVRWSPAALHPRLAAQQHLELRVVPAEPAPVVDRTGTPLLTPQTVVTVALDPAKTPDLPAVAASLAAALAPFDPGITAQSITAGAGATRQGQRQAVATLREQDYQSVRDRIHDLPGVSFPTQRQLLAPDRGFASQLMPGIGGKVEQQLTGAAGWHVITVDAVGAQVAELAGQDPRPVPTVTTTVDRGVQASAEDAVNIVPNPAMIVAIQPSTGGILAVAQNAAADAHGALALTGRYPPGSTFKIVTASAALQAHQSALDAPVDCPATTTIGGRVVPNDHLFALGSVPLRTAFARSCNTTFARLASGMSGDQLTETARRLGLGMDYTVPGITTVTGQVPPSDSTVQRAEDGFGQGRVLASPFGMALVASTIAAGGRTPTPELITGMATTTATPAVQPLPREVVDAVRTMMREVVTQGTGKALSGQGELFGKTGTAEFSPAGAHGWFVGFRGDMAFATLVVDAGSSGPALDVSGRFLAALGAAG